MVRKESQLKLLTSDVPMYHGPDNHEHTLDRIRGLAFDVQGYTVHDGPGTRTLVFLSGCPIRCSWCSNPEGQLLIQRLMYKPGKCKACPLRCVEACRSHAISVSKNETPPLRFDRNLCNNCDRFDCVKVCYTEALQVSGRWYTVQELMRILARDRQYWGSEGGVCFSGGEPLLQHQFIVAVLQACHQSYIHTALETCAHVPTPKLLEVLPYVDWLFADIKHMNPDQHQRETGVDNALILHNIRRILDSGWNGRLVIRSPIIPGFNDTRENAEGTAIFMKEIGVREINLLPFHRLGASKYEQLGLPYTYAHHESPSPDLMMTLKRVYEARGLACYLGSDTPF